MIRGTQSSSTSRASTGLRAALTRYARSDDWARRRPHVLFLFGFALTAGAILAYRAARGAALALVGHPEATRAADAVAVGIVGAVLARWAAGGARPVWQTVLRGAAAGAAFWLLGTLLCAGAA
jgi:hypothetical protein